MEPYPGYPGTYLERLPRTTRQSLSTYSEPLGRFSQLPRELQMETFLRLSWKDREHVCLSNNPPSICFSEELWKRLISEIPSFTTNIILSLVLMLIPIIDNILRETSIPGPKKYFLLIEHPSITLNLGKGSVVIKASDAREALAKANENFSRTTRGITLYWRPVEMYFINTPKRDFSFKSLVNYVLKHMLENNNHRLVEVKVVE